MADEPENMAPRILRSMDGKLDRVIQRLDNLDARMTAQERQSEIIIMRTNGMQAEFSEQGKRLDRIERRLDLAEADE